MWRGPRVRSARAQAARGSVGIALAWLALLASACDGGASAVDPDGGPIDGGALAADAGAADGGRRCATAPGEAPETILFIGNSFTFTANMPRIVRDLAVAAGFPEPRVEVRAIGGQTLEGHLADTSPDGAPARVMEGWDVVVLQELSTRPTDAIGPAEQYKRDAAAFYDLAKLGDPDARVFLYETFARRAGHPVYPGTFRDPADMQRQLRLHHEDAAERYIPQFSTAAVRTDVWLARVGDAWEHQLLGGEPPRLHGDDDYHPNAAGAYLTALVIFGSIYDRRTAGLAAIGVDEATARALQANADHTTRATSPPPIFGCRPTLAIGAQLAIDFGPLPAPGWAAHADVAGTIGPIARVDGAPTAVRVTTEGWVGAQTGGSADNTLGYPADVSRDTLWIGTFDGHAAALAMRGRVIVTGLDGGDYELVAFASRDGTDGGAGRLSRYRVGDREIDVEIADNRSRTAVFSGVRPDASGAIVLDTVVSPAGASRFAYLGSLVLTKRGP